MNRYGLRHYALLAGFGFLSLALFVQGVLPMAEPQSRSDAVSRVVRTELGELKWIEYRARDYTPQQARGRAVYIREGCAYCHSQYIRPVAGETRRWGPLSQAGEYAWDRPHLFSTRRIGPDLARVGLKYSDSWHLAHLWDPRMLSPDSIMPRYRALFDGPYRARLVTDADGRRSIEHTAQSERLFDYSGSERLLLTPNADGLLFVPVRGRYPIIHTPNAEFSGDEVQLVAASADLLDLVAYLQSLGMQRGQWRDLFEPQRLEVVPGGMPRSEEWIAHGAAVYRRRCLGCHGVRGDGNGPAATFLYDQRPRDFTLGVFKFRLTPAGALPDDGDLLRTLSRGVRGTSMPSWHELPDKDRLAVIQYLKYVLAIDRSAPERPRHLFIAEPAQAPLFIGTAPPPSAQRVAQGRAVWQKANCWVCHGQHGRGDAESGVTLNDDRGFPIHPADLAAGQFKSGPDVRDIYRTLSTGLSGTPMQSYADTLSAEERWALAYYVLSLSAYRDPLDGTALELSAQARAALADPALRAAQSSNAYRAADPAAPHYGGAAWALKHGFDATGLDDAGDPPWSN